MSSYKVWLYKSGNEYTTTTGGWSKAYTIYDGVFTKKADRMFFSINSESYSTNILNVSTEKNYDISRIKLFAFKYSGSGVGNMGLKVDKSKSDTFVDFDNADFNDTTSSMKTEGLVVTGRTGRLYPFCGAYSYSNTLSEVEYHQIWLETEDVVTIHSQTQDSINFSVDNIIDGVIIKKVQLLSNNKVISEYTSNFTNIIYNFDADIMDYGSNKISMMVTYMQQDDNEERLTEHISDILYYKEVSLEEFKPIENLPEDAEVDDVLYRIIEISSVISALQSSLIEILKFGGVNIDSDCRFSEAVNSTSLLIDKINENKDKLLEILVNKGVDVDVTNSYEELLNIIKKYFYEIKIIGAEGLPEWYNTQPDVDAVVPTVTYEDSWIGGKENNYITDGSTREGVGLVAVGNYIHVIGGVYWNDRNDYYDHYIYDTINNTWSKSVDIPGSGRGYSGCCLLNDKIYVIGGSSYDGDGYNNNCYFDLNTNTWTNKTTITYASPVYCAEAINNKIYCLRVNNRYDLMYDPSTNAWTSLGTFSLNPSTGRQFGAASIGTKIYCIGGSTEYNMAFHKAFDTTTKTWSTIATTPDILDDEARSTVVGDRIYTIYNNNYKPGFYYDTKTNVYEYIHAGNAMYRYNIVTANNKVWFSEGTYISCYVPKG